MSNILRAQMWAIRHFVCACTL